jgi:hypothetical protein
MGLVAQCEVKVPGQILIVNPPITGSPVGFGERPPIAVAGDGDATFVDGGVMPLTQQHQIASTSLNVPTAATDQDHHYVAVRQPERIGRKHIAARKPVQMHFR